MKEKVLAPPDVTRQGSLTSGNMEGISQMNGHWAPVACKLRFIFPFSSYDPRTSRSPKRPASGTDARPCCRSEVTGRVGWGGGVSGRQFTSSATGRMSQPPQKGWQLSWEPLPPYSPLHSSLATRFLLLRQRPFILLSFSVPRQNGAAHTHTHTKTGVRAARETV